MSLILRVGYGHFRFFLMIMRSSIVIYHFLELCQLFFHNFNLHVFFIFRQNFFLLFSTIQLSYFFFIELNNRFMLLFKELLNSDSTLDNVIMYFVSSFSLFLSLLLSICFNKTSIFLLKRQSLSFDFIQILTFL